MRAQVLPQVAFFSIHCAGSSNLTDTEQSDSEVPAQPSTIRSSSAAERTCSQPSIARTTSQRRRQRTSAKVSKPSRTLKPGYHGNTAAHGRGLSHQGGATHGANQPGSSPSPPHWPGSSITSPSADRRRKTRLLMESRKGKSQGGGTSDASVQVGT